MTRHSDSLPSSPIKVLIADDHAFVRARLRELFGDGLRLWVVGEATNGKEAVLLARALRPDVVVMDVSMPEMDGVEATRRIRAELPSIQVVGLSTHHPGDFPPAIIEAGASAYFVKGEGLQHLLAHLSALADTGIAGVGPSA